MDVMLIKAINDFYLFDLDVGQEEVLDHLRQALHLDERSAAMAMAELIANDYLQIIPGRTAAPGGFRTQALVRAGPKLTDYAANAT